jgi:hypothetical protein
VGLPQIRHGRFLLTRSKPTEIIAFIGPFPRGRAQFHFMPDKFHFMPDEFHYMPDKFHLMPDPTLLIRGAAQ